MICLCIHCLIQQTCGGSGLSTPKSMAILLGKTGAFHTLSFPLVNFFTPKFLFNKTHPSSFCVRANKMEETEIKEVGEMSSQKKIFVAGATGSTGKRIVEQLLQKGFSVKAGVRDTDKAKTIFPTNSALQFVKADVTDGSDKLAEAISDDSEALICATGFQRSWDPLAPWKVDYNGTINLVEACRKCGVKRFILISSILVNGAAMGQLFNPAYIILNVFGLVLVAKLQAENYIRKSGINYTIVRPGGLKNDPPSGNIVMEPEDTLSEGSISRDQVAEVAVEALNQPDASYKVVEIIAKPDAPKRSFGELFGAIKQQ